MISLVDRIIIDLEILGIKNNHIRYGSYNLSRLGLLVCSMITCYYIATGAIVHALSQLSLYRTVARVSA